MAHSDMMKRALLRHCFLLSGILFAHIASSQIFVEAGVPQAYNYNFSSEKNFWKSHGTYIHLGYEMKKMSIHAKLYSAPFLSKNQTAYGSGFGFSRIESFERHPKLKLHTGVGGLWVQRRQDIRNPSDYDLQSVFLEIQMRYFATDQLYMSTEVTYGWGYQNYLKGNASDGFVADAPYRLAFGVGWKFKKR